jgi:hypothetical protein
MNKLISTPNRRDILRQTQVATAAMELSTWHSNQTQVATLGVMATAKPNSAKNRRAFLRGSLLAGACVLMAIPLRGAVPTSLAGAVEQAHTVLWSRFIDAHGVMIDFTDLDGTVNYPTPEE